MSRTRKDRPFWVRSNDPKERREFSHNHIKIHREKVDEEKHIHTPAETIRDENGYFLYNVPEYSWMVNVYRQWVEYIGCNIDEPVTHAEPRWHEGCRSWAVELGYGWPRHSAKKAVSQARRHNVKQQLHTLINTYGWSLDVDPWSEYPNWDEAGERYWVDTPNWWDVDIEENPLYAKNCWWD